MPCGHIQLESVALAGLIDAVGGVVEQGRAHGCGDGLDLGEFDSLSLSGASAMTKGGEDGDDGVAGIDGVVGVVGADADRSAIRVAGEMRDSGGRREHGAEAEEVSVGSPEALHRRVGGDDIRASLRRVPRRSGPSAG